MLCAACGRSTLAGNGSHHHHTARCCLGARKGCWRGVGGLGHAKGGCPGCGERKAEAEGEGVAWQGHSPQLAILPPAWAPLPAHSRCPSAQEQWGGWAWPPPTQLGPG